MLIFCSEQDWSTVIAKSGKTRHYRFIMTELKVAKYINYDIPLKFRISLSKFRCSVHNLNVETDQHRVGFMNNDCVYYVISIKLKMNFILF